MKGLFLCITLAVLVFGDAAAEEAAPGAPAVPFGEAAADAAQRLGLSDCYGLALKRSEQIAIQKELILETEGRFQRAFSGILPRVSFASSDKIQDGAGTTAFNLRHVPERKFTFTQPLFSGFKEFAAIDASRAEKKKAAYNKTRAEHLLFIDVSDAFHLLLEERQDLEALEAIRATLNERIEELKSREQLGRSRPSEAVKVEAQLRGIEAEMERVRSIETTAEQLLGFLTGLEHIGAIADSEGFAPSLDGEEAYAAKAAARPDVHALEETWHSAQQDVRIANGDRWPTLSSEGNYYTERVGVSQTIDWDVTFKVNMPLYQGGEVAGAIKEALARAEQSRLKFEEAKRRAVLEARDTYSQLAAAFKRTAALEKALEATEKSYQLQVEEYRLNLVSNLDVLEALKDVQDNRRDVISIKNETKRLYRRLKVAAGETL